MRWPWHRIAVSQHYHGVKGRLPWWHHLTLFSKSLPRRISSQLPFEDAWHDDFESCMYAHVTHVTPWYCHVSCLVLVYLLLNEYHYIWIEMNWWSIRLAAPRFEAVKDGYGPLFLWNIAAVLNRTICRYCHCMNELPFFFWDTKERGVWLVTVNESSRQSLKCRWRACKSCWDLSFGESKSFACIVKGMKKGLNA